MTPLLTLAARSAWNRRFALGLVALSIALSTFLLLGIERLRQDVRASFSQAVSGTDLIVGARTGPVQLLLYAVFRIGNATNNIRVASLDALAQHRAVAWVVPLSLGDSHRGFAVLGTTVDYFQRFRFGDKQALRLAQGRAFAAVTPSDTRGLYEAVLGADVARRLGYALGQRVVLSHGDGAMAANDHADKPFTVVGILAPTGTPVDRTLHIGLQAIEAIHLDWAAGAPLAGQAVSAAQAAAADLRPRTVTAALVGLKSRAAVFAVQREVANYRDEPLLAILPGVALDELWDVVGLGERGLQAMSALVALVSLAGLVAVILAGLNERRRELAILRAVGAGPRQVLLLLALEGGLVTAAGVLAGALACALAVAVLAPWVQGQYGLLLRPQAPGGAEWLLMAVVLAGGWSASLLPGWRAYRLSLADGLSPRI
jgi:putative ABC transport system permease protein